MFLEDAKMFRCHNEIRFYCWSARLWAPIRNQNGSYSSARYYLFIVQKPGQATTTTGIMWNIKCSSWFSRYTFQTTRLGSLGYSKTISPIQKGKRSVFTPSERAAVASIRSTSSTVTVAPTASDSLEPSMNEAGDIQPSH